MPRLYLFWQPPNMLPVQQLWTAEAYKSYETAQGRSAAGRTREMSLGAVLGLGAAVLGWSLMA